MMVHDQTASTVSLARQILQGIDRRSLNTPVQTESLVLLLTTFIDLATPRHPSHEAAARTVATNMARAAVAARGT